MLEKLTSDVNLARLANPTDETISAFAVVTSSTPSQRRALELLGVAI
jgi:hypothetical protein